MITELFRNIWHFTDFLSQNKLFWLPLHFSDFFCAVVNLQLVR